MGFTITKILKILAVIALVLLLSSCKHNEKYEFIQNFLEEPEKIIELLGKADFDAANELKYLKKSKLYFNRYISWAKNFKMNESNDNKVLFEVSHYCSDRNLVKITQLSELLLSPKIISAEGNVNLKTIFFQNKPNKSI